MRTLTCTAPVNIALIKYWGKRDESLILPVNSSLSVTLNQNQLRTKTTVAVSESFSEDRMWLNSEEQSMKNPRVQNVLKEIRRRARKRKDFLPDCDGVDGHLADVESHVHICSENNFPTAAGLASSAAGYACLVYALAKLFKVEGEISDIARLGSGSSCRSIYGGFVEWVAGHSVNGADSIARQIAEHSHWPELRILILVVSEQKKHTSSTQGMQTSVKNSELLKIRARSIVPERLLVIKRAIQERNFGKFAEITMKESNQFHAICLDTFPPISYLTDVSRQIIRLVHQYNDTCQQTKVAYTFDAGPNACLYLLEEDVPQLLALITHFFPPSTPAGGFVQGLPVVIPAVQQGDFDTIFLDLCPGAIKYVIYTDVGCGPQLLLDSESSLLNGMGYPVSA